MPLGGNCSLTFLNASHIDWNKLLQQSSIGLLEVTASETAISVVSITASHIDSNLFIKTRSFCLIFGPIVNSRREEEADGCSTQCRAEGAAVHSSVKRKRKNPYIRVNMKV